jgi:hypothetical protein
VQSDDAALGCLSCGADAPGLYCPQCGQLRQHQRHTIKSLAGGALARVFNVESGLTHTAYSLTFHPDAVVRDYVAGATARYTHPAMYLVIAFALFSVSGRWFGGFTGGGDVERVAALAFVPLVAVAARLTFARTRFNYAEHLILAMYAFGHVALAFAVILIVFPLLPTSTARAVAAILFVGGIIYTASVYARVFRRRPIMDALRALAAMLIGALLWGLLLFGFIRFIVPLIVRDSVTNA